MYRERAGAEHLFSECFANLVAQDLIAGACFAESSSHGSGAEVEGAGDLVGTCCVQVDVGEQVSDLGGDAVAVSACGDQSSALLFALGECAWIGSGERLGEQVRVERDDVFHVPPQHQPRHRLDQLYAGTASPLHPASRRGVGARPGWGPGDPRGGRTALRRRDAATPCRPAWAGCVSWYKSASGRTSSNWPGLVSEYSRRTATSSLADFQADAVSRESGVAERDTFLTSVQEVPTVVATRFLDNVQERWVR